MTRRALIVAAGGINGLAALPGTVLDAQRIRAHLLSDEGGAWEPSEVETFSRLQLQPAAQQHRYHYDFILFYFAGHGSMGENGTNYLYMSEGPPQALENIVWTAPRQLVILDACRVLDLDEGAVRKADSTFGGLFKGADAGYRARCRRVFDDAVTMAGLGQTVLFGCAPHQTAGEIPGRGGRFTQALVDGADAWTNASGPGPRVLEATAALGLAARRINPTVQNPMASPGRRLHDFPFAVVG